MRIAEIIKQTLEQFTEQARAENVHIAFMASNDVSEFSADPQSVVHDVSYLIERLLSFVPENESINVELRAHEDGRIFLCVANTGIDLHMFTGVVRHCFLPTTVYENGPNATR